MKYIKLFENYSQNELVNRIVDILPELHKEYGDFMSGGCEVFARIVCELTGIDRVCFLFDEGEQIEGDPPMHIYVKVDDNLYLDGSGLITENEIIEEYDIDEDSDYFFLEDESYEELMEHYSHYQDSDFTYQYQEDYEEIKEFIKQKIS